MRKLTLAVLILFVCLSALPLFAEPRERSDAPALAGWTYPVCQSYKYQPRDRYLAPGTQVWYREEARTADPNSWLTRLILRLRPDWDLTYVYREYWLSDGSCAPSGDWTLLYTS